MKEKFSLDCRLRIQCFLQCADLATEKAEEHIKKYVKKYASEKQIKMEIHILQKIHSYIPDVEIKNLMIKYHNSKIEAK